MTCDTCRYWTAETDRKGHPKDVGDCRRYPPQLLTAARGDAGHATFPQTGPDEWCGEHRDRP